MFFSNNVVISIFIRFYLFFAFFASLREPNILILFFTQSRKARKEKIQSKNNPQRKE